MLKGGNLHIRNEGLTSRCAWSSGKLTKKLNNCGGHVRNTSSTQRSVILQDEEFTNLKADLMEYPSFLEPAPSGHLRNCSLLYYSVGFISFSF